MSYEPTNWKSGDVVTSAKLNKLEQGVAAAGGVLVVNVTESEVEGSMVSTCDKTAGEMAAALESGGIIFRVGYGDDSNYYTLVNASVAAGNYSFSDSGSITYEAASASEYPTSSGGK